MKNIRLSKVEKEIQSALLRVSRSKAFQGSSSRKQKTLIIKRALARLGTSHRYNVYTTAERSYDNPEWVWDIVWTIQTGITLKRSGYQAIKRIVLIVECEWFGHETAIVEDFEKLRFGVADSRLYVFSMKSREHAEDVLNICQGLCSAGPETGFRYMLIGIPAGAGQENFVRQWIH